MAWGHFKYGGDSSDVHEQLRNVKHIQASTAAFAAVLDDASIVVWGHQVDDGSDGSDCQEKLENP